MSGPMSEPVSDPVAEPASEPASEPDAPKAGRGASALPAEPASPGLRRVLDVDVLGDPATRRVVAKWSLALLALGAAHVAALVLVGGFTPVGWPWWVALVAGYLACLPLHELVHAAFFKLFGRRGLRVRFGCSSGMLYAGCPGERFPRRRFMVVLIAPFVLFGLCFLLLGTLGCAPLLAASLFWLHTSGCAGDFYFAWLALRHPEAPWCEDTDRGFSLWAVGGDGVDAPGKAAVPE